MTLTSSNKCFVKANLVSLLIIISFQSAAQKYFTGTYDICQGLKHGKLYADSGLCPKLVCLRYLNFSISKKWCYILC